MFPPLVAGGAGRMGQFARMLPEYGWDVTVVTERHSDAVSFDHDAEAAIAQRARIVRAWSPMNDVVKRGTPVPKRGFRSVARRFASNAVRSVMFPDRQILWAPGAIRAGARVLAEQPHDAVIATYGPGTNLIVGHYLARRAGLPLVVDFRDLWSTLPMDAFPTALHRAAALRLERAIVRRSSRLIAVSPAMAEDLAHTHGVAIANACSITNGFDPADLGLVRDSRGPEPRPFRLVYTGTVHADYDLGALWRALRTLADQGVITKDNFRVEFVGNLSISDVRSYGLEDLVESRPYVAHADVFAALAKADALLVVETPGYYARYGYAAKVFDYVLTGKPVVALVDHGGNTDSLLRATGVGHTVAPDDVPGIEQVLRDVLRLKGVPPKRVDPDVSPLRDFNREHLVEKLAMLLDEVVATEDAGYEEAATRRPARTVRDYQT